MNEAKIINGLKSIKRCAFYESLLLLLIACVFSLFFDAKDTGIFFVRCAIVLWLFSSAIIGAFIDGYEKEVD